MFEKKRKSLVNYNIHRYIVDILILDRNTKITKKKKKTHLRRKVNKEYVKNHMDIFNDEVLLIRQQMVPINHELYYCHSCIIYKYTDISHFALSC